MMEFLSELRVFLKRIPIISPLGSFVLRLKRLYKGKFLRLINPDGAYLKCNGLNVFCDFSNENYWWYDGFAPNLAFDNKIIANLIVKTKGSVFLDIGAHFGYFSAVICNELLKNNKSTTLIAIEPDEKNYKCLVKTLEKYNQKTLKTVTLPYAISDTDGVQKMYESMQPCLHSYAEPGSVVKSEVKSITLNTLLEEYAPSEKLAFIKIDIDGAEPLFFKGGWEVLDKHKPIIFIEFAPKCLEYSGENVKEYYNNLCDHFHVYWIAYQNVNAQKIEKSDYEMIIDEVGDMVTDFVLSYEPLSVN